MGFTQLKPLSEEEYIAAEDTALERHEFVHGATYAMAGASERHNTIAGNLIAICHAARTDSGCRPFTSSMRLRLDGGSTYYYPDVMLVCTPDDNDPMFKTQPCMVAEVSSLATEATDRREKFAAYTKLPSLSEYLILAQDEMRVDHYARLNLREWGHRQLGAGDALILQSLSLNVSVDELYATVDFGPC